MRESLPILPGLTAGAVLHFCIQVFDARLHRKQVRSLANGVIGVMHADSLAVTEVGRGLARATGRSAKHAVKQVDRLLSNPKVSMEEAFLAWVPWVVASRRDIVVSMDWTEFDPDEQATLAICMVTEHGRATPLVWKTVNKFDPGTDRSRVERELVSLFHAAVPSGVRVTILADRGFGNVDLYKHIRALGFDYVIRFRGKIRVHTASGASWSASELVHGAGKPRRYNDVKVTNLRVPVSGVVTVRDKRMKEAWCLATSRWDTAQQIVDLYGRRFTVEETFRDVKDHRFGLGLRHHGIGQTDRRDRLLLLTAVAEALLTLVGAAGEQIGLDRQLKTNTVPERTHSLFRQGREYLSGVGSRMHDQLASAFQKILDSWPRTTSTYAFI